MYAFHLPFTYLLQENGGGTSIGDNTHLMLAIHPCVAVDHYANRVLSPHGIYRFWETTCMKDKIALIKCDKGSRGVEIEQGNDAKTELELHHGNC